MKRIFVPTQDASDWQRLLAQPELHWKPAKSAMATALCWNDAGDRLPPEVAGTLGATGEPALAGLQLLVAMPEWDTPLPGGTTSSMTDVLALARNDAGLVVVAVEGKVNEDFGPTLGEKRRGSAGQSERLRYLEQELQLSARLADSVRYQLLHRTVSALLAARAFHATAAVMLIHSFGDDTRLHDDYAAFCEAMGAMPAGENVCVVKRFTAPKLFLAWCHGDRKYLSLDARAKRPS
jgi:hypothetical protein